MSPADVADGRNTVIDVGEPYELRAGRIKGARNAR